ncbi:MED13L [Cordylochernes scorpioides]|uniref:Mediator of RNA polymerase II transcription subunit 13 n=1 Tax=Cordylochernes scorpioides TaxID=51811 RepID=A0ABY6JYU6_9ARAC|nr:MED13L [Cordylochernes scorpioides]
MPLLVPVRPLGRERTESKPSPPLWCTWWSPSPWPAWTLTCTAWPCWACCAATTQLVRGLPPHLQQSLQLQMVSLDSILSLGDGPRSRRKDQLKTLAFSVYSQCRPTSSPQPPIKSLTGFGPAASQDLFLRTNKGSITSPHRLGSLPYFLAPQKNKQTELGEMFGDRKERSNVLVCSYCLTEDQRWLLATCTNDRGDLLEAITINIDIPFRARRRRASSRKIGLQKLFMFLMGVMSQSTCPWRVVVARMGRIGQGELREWGSLLGRKSLLFYSNQLREMCQQCSVLGAQDTPAILSACLVALEPDNQPPHHGRPVHNRTTASPPPATTATSPPRTTLPAPTSWSSPPLPRPGKPSSQQEHIDALSTSLVDEDFFQDLNEEDITTVGQDINDLLGWTDGLGQSPTGSPHRSQPGSPGGGMGGGTVRGGAEATDERLTLHQQPLALGYYVSTAPTGPLPPVVLGQLPPPPALLPRLPAVQQNSDELLHASAPVRNNHPLDSSLTSDVLRYVLEGFNALSWLALDPHTYDRRSCLPIHMQVLMQLYYGLEALV